MTPEESLMIPAGDATLEARRRPAEARIAGVVAHPHPLYGGAMTNNVVEAAAAALFATGRSTLRFNFRGVGRSTGRHDQGQAEQRDLAAMVSFLKNSGAEEVVVAGYSFGAWVAAWAWPLLAELGAGPLILIAPPAAMMSFADLPAGTRIDLIVCGEHDQIGPPALAAELGRRLTAPVTPRIVPGADHFFGGFEADLERIIVDFLNNLP